MFRVLLGVRRLLLTQRSKMRHKRLQQSQQRHRILEPLKARQQRSPMQQLLPEAMQLQRLERVKLQRREM
jgi:hypothetical protein